MKLGLKNTLIGMAVLSLFFLQGCGESFDRGVKDIQSDLGGGLDRICYVYSYDGQLLTQYEGKFDIKNNDSGTQVKFDLNGKRTIIYNAIVIVEEVENSNSNIVVKPIFIADKVSDMCVKIEYDVENPAVGFIAPDGTKIYGDNCERSYGTSWAKYYLKDVQVGEYKISYVKGKNTNVNIIVEESELKSEVGE